MVGPIPGKYLGWVFYVNIINPPPQPALIIGLLETL